LRAAKLLATLIVSRRDRWHAMTSRRLTSRILTCTVLKGHWRCFF